MKKKLIWQLYPSYILLALACLLMVALPAFHSLRQTHQQQVVQNLQLQAKLLATASMHDDKLITLPALTRMVAAAHTATRITIILPDGTVALDTQHDAASMENHKDRPEIQAAMQGSPDAAERFSRTLRQTMVYVTHPITHDDTVLGVVRTSRALTGINAEAKALSAQIGLGVILALLLATAGAYFVSRIVTRPLHLMKQGADRFAAGDLHYRMPAPRSLEMATLADAMNGMAAQIHDRLELIARERHLEQVRSDFVANVSHELKTPITAIKGFVETLQDGADDDASARQRFMEIIHRQADHLDAIVDDLLVLSRLEHDDQHQHVTREHQPLTPILQAAIDTCAPRAEAKGIPITFDGAPGISAAVNPHLFEQAVVNLVDNAIKYSGPGAAISLQTRTHQGRLEIIVADNGCGIAPQHLERLFERFYRVDTGRSRAMGGTGLGLAIVKHIVLVHDGDVAVTSLLGEGTTFTISLPAIDTPGTTAII